jgi:HicA toxin of bacterial toxin-antitoxin,
MRMNKTHQKTLKSIFESPINGNIEWSRIEALLVSVGCSVIKGSGSSVTFEKNGMKVFFHRPHPQKEALRYRVKDAREFLNRIGISP